MDIQEIVSGIGASDALGGVAQKLGLSPDQAQAALQGVLEHASSGEPLEGLIDNVVSRTGLDPSQVQQFLPNVMGLLQGHAENANEGVQETISGLLGSLQGGSVVDGALGALKGLFNR